MNDATSSNQNQAFSSGSQPSDPQPAGQSKDPAGYSGAGQQGSFQGPVGQQPSQPTPAPENEVPSEQAAQQAAATQDAAQQPPVQTGQPMPPHAPAPQPSAGGGANDLSSIMEENVDIGGLVANAGQNQQQSEELKAMKIKPHPNTTFDESKFLDLLAGSISLTISEKKRIVDAIPQLSQFQIDELMKIFEEEKGKFAELEKKHADQVAELEKQHAGSWQDLEAKKEEEEKAQKEAEEAEELKKRLGL